MQFFQLPPHIPVLIVDDFYTQEELVLIWKELVFLTDDKKLKAPEKTNAASEGGKYLKSAHGVWLDKLYADRDTSNVLNCNRKIFSKDFIEKVKGINSLYCILDSINSDSTLLNYYEDGGEYKKHRDASVFTAITMFLKNPSKFDGGDFLVHDCDLLIEKRNNRLILFPGILEHSVTPVKMNAQYEPFGGDGRYTVTQFLHVV